MQQHGKEIEVGVEQLLEGKQFNHSVELGCGMGGFGHILMNHTQWLVGVDINPDFIKKARHYDEIVEADIRTYDFEYADSVFLFEIIEHLHKEEGLRLLNRIFCYVMVSTPVRFYNDAVTGHVSHWTVDDFYQLGFDVWKMPSANWKWGGFLLAVHDHRF